jgi:hypothetical protein
MQQRPAVARRHGVRAVGALGTPQAGVLVYNPTAQPEISHNEIYGNAGSGIEVRSTATECSEHARVAESHMT